jgi:CubicO group peptidase (beta-lactamase class C family)
MVDARSTPTFQVKEETAKAVRALAANRAHRQGIPALAYGIVGGGRLIAAGGMGDPGDGAGPPEERTLFRIASMTKSFTAAAFLNLRDTGYLTLDDPAARYVPPAAGLQPPATDSATITLRHLLTMSSGLTTDDPWADRHLDVAGPELLAWLAEGASFAAVPGTVFEYSNLGYGLLGQVVEAVAGMRLQEYVNRHFLEPLGMRDTVWDAKMARPDARLARPFRHVDGVPVAEPEPLPDGALGPMGGLWSTVADLAVWVAFLADAFPPRDDPDDGPLRRASRREMQQASRLIPASITREELDGPLRLVAGGYGMGLEVREHLQLGTMVTHSGGLPGYGSNMRWLPDRGVGVIALANLTYPNMAAFTRDVLELLLSHGALPPVRTRTAPKVEQAAAELCALLSTWDDARARRLFADNVELDDTLERRRARAAALRARHGALLLGAVTAEDATSGTADLIGERGRVRLTLLLAPRPDGRVQRYEAVSVMPASDALIEATRRLAALAGASDAGALAALLEPGAAVDEAARQLDALHVLFGRLTVGDVVAGNGPDENGDEVATFRWQGERGNVDITLRRTSGRLRIERISPRPLPDA